MRIQKGERRGGRQKGTPNKINARVKEAILHAFEEVGGVAYLVNIAREDHKTFCMLLSKVLPKDTQSVEITPQEGIKITIKSGDGEDEEFTLSDHADDGS